MKDADSLRVELGDKVTTSATVGKAEAKKQQVTVMTGTPNHTNKVCNCRATVTHCNAYRGRRESAR